MRIGILTYHCVTNFGAQLQTLSTIGYMKNSGHEPIILNWFPKDLENFYLRQHPRIQFEEQYNFSQNNMPVSRLCRTLDELCEEINRLSLDSIFLGSDALFDYLPKKSRNPFAFRELKHKQISITSNHDIPNPFWGSFNDLLKKSLPYSGFSISSQNSPYKKVTKKEKAELGRLLNNFSLISVRDKWTQCMVEYLSGRKDVFITPDPVFAFNYNFTNPIKKEYLTTKYSLPDKYILISFGQNTLKDEFVNEIILKIERKTGYPCVSLAMPRGLKQYNTKYKIDLPLPTLDWYHLIRYSQGYIGELMHPIIVCLHNSVPFFCFDQYGISKRIIPGLYNRYIKESSKIYDILQRASLLENSIPYAHVNSISPDDVVKAFCSFNRIKCGQFAKHQYLCYLDGMKKIMLSLQL